MKIRSLAAACIAALCLTLPSLAQQQQRKTLPTLEEQAHLIASQHHSGIGHLPTKW